jgi:hypothetical protein
VIERLRAQEEGSALALALAFLTLFGLLVGTLLGSAETGLRSAKALTRQGDEVAAASGAVDGAINRLRADLSAGRQDYDETCFTAPPINQVSVNVRCVGQPGSGETSGGGEGPADGGHAPPFALWSLGSGAGGEGGIVEDFEDSTIAVDGPIYSRSTISALGTVAVDGRVQALGNCTGPITSTDPPLRCANTGGGADPDSGVDPLYPPDQDTPPAPQSVPSCPSGWLVTFLPGRYMDATGLTNLMKNCEDRVFHFTPGFYYFLFPNGAPVWEIDHEDTTIIGGTPLDWSTDAPSKPSIDVPGGCDPDAAGVQFVFGRRSRLSLKQGRLELCAQPHEGSQRIAIYGASDAAPPGYVPQNSCIVSTPFPGPGCAFISIDSQTAAFIVHGTVYAPGAAVRITIDKDARVQFRRGLIARTILLEVDKLWDQTAPLGRLPENGGGGPVSTADRVVVLIARIEDVGRVRARVTFADGNGTTPGAGVTVNDWVVVR